MATIDIAPPDAPDQEPNNNNAGNQHQPPPDYTDSRQNTPPHADDEDHETDESKRASGNKNALLALALAFGAVVPTVVLAGFGTINFEGIWRLTCRLPVETIVQIGMLLLVPLANVLVADAAKRNNPRHQLKLSVLQGTAIGVSGIVTIASMLAYLATLTPVGAAHNIGANFSYLLISIVSLASTASSLYTGWLLRNTKETRAARNKTVIFAALGMLIAVGSLLGSEARSAYVRFVEWQASSETASEREQAIDTLRSLGTEKDLRMEIADARVGGFSGIFYALNPSTIRQLYFAVAGKPYLDQYTDIATMPSEFLSRDIVGEKIQGLSLLRSTMTGSVNPDSLTSTVNWVFIFKNRSMFNQEARAQIALPNGGVVSGLTLSVNGKPQSAAFAGNDRVTGAYNWVAHSNRDPALVTYLGKERVLLQCAPVPAQGEMKVALAISAPVNLQAKSDASMSLPKLLNTNFSVVPNNEHTLRLRTPSDAEITMEKVRRASNGTQSMVVGELKETEMTGSGLALRLHKLPEFQPVAAYDPLSRSYVVETVKEVVPTVPSNLVIVVDGSVRMKDSAKQVRTVLQKLPPNVNATMVVAGDGNVSEPVSIAEGLKQLDHLNYKGGCDNLRAVVKAAEVAGETPQSAVLWLHGPQPSLNNEMYAMAPYVHTPKFFEVALDGADSNTSEFFKNHREIGPFSVIAAGPTAVGDLERYIYRWHPGGREFISDFSCTFEKPSCRILDAKANPEQTRELLALGANNQCEKLIAKNHRNLAASLASQARIVSQMTGAVVLERESDYQTWQLRHTDGHRAAEIQGATNATIEPVDNVVAPDMQGATNGTVGPQGEDATVIMGVNTAGTVRVNNLANLEAFWNIVSTLAEIVLVITGGTQLVLAVTKSESKGFCRRTVGRVERALWGLALLGGGLLLPNIVNWMVASARDANLFS